MLLRDLLSKISLIPLSPLFLLGSLNISKRVMYIYQLIAILKLSIRLYYFTQTNECILLRMYNSACYAFLHRCTPFPCAILRFSCLAISFPRLSVCSENCPLVIFQPILPSADGPIHLLHKQLICWFIRTNYWTKCHPLFQGLWLQSADQPPSACSNCLLCVSSSPSLILNRPMFCFRCHFVPLRFIFLFQ